MLKKKKTFVLDTNVILHDSTSLRHFQENDIVLPITVLEEIDHFKKGNESINFHAREFIRMLDALSGDGLFNGGITIGDGLGKLSIKLEQEFHPDLALNFSQNIPDHHILNIAYHYAKAHPNEQVILVTKDGNFRMKAKSVGLLAEDYTTDHVKDISRLYTGRRVVDDVPDDMIDQMYRAPYEIAVSDLAVSDDLLPNEYLIIRNGKKSALAAYNSTR